MIRLLFLHFNGFWQVSIDYSNRFFIPLFLQNLFLPQLQRILHLYLSKHLRATHRHYILLRLRSLNSTLSRPPEVVDCISISVQHVTLERVAHPVTLGVGCLSVKKG